MPKPLREPHARRSARISKDGCTVFVRLRVDRRAYAFAQSWAAHHAGPDLHLTAEDNLEGTLNAALLDHMANEDWSPPDEIAALYANIKYRQNTRKDLDDDILF